MGIHKLKADRRGAAAVRLAAAALLALSFASGAAAQKDGQGSASPPTFGREDARAVLEVFIDYQCPSCANLHPTLTELMSQHREGVRLIFRNFPLTSHPLAEAAARAAEAAAMQGKFPEMMDALFKGQMRWGESARPARVFIAYAKSLGMDTGRFVRDMNGPEVSARLSADRARAIELNVQGTPTVFFNDKELKPLPFFDLKRLVDEALRGDAPSNSQSLTNP